MSKLIDEDLTYQMIGAYMEAHRHLECGFFEAVYQEALALEFRMRSIPFEQEKVLDIYYKDILLEKKYCADFICYDKIIVELKALSKLASEHEVQLLNYLKATGLHVGLLVNFGAKSLEYKRIVH